MLKYVFRLRKCENVRNSSIQIFYYIFPLKKLKCIIFFSSDVGLDKFEFTMMTFYISYIYNRYKCVVFTLVIHITDVKCDIFYIGCAYNECKKIMYVGLDV